MDELAARVSAALGVDAEVARTAIGLVLGFLEKESPERRRRRITRQAFRRARGDRILLNPPAAGAVSQD